VIDIKVNFFGIVASLLLFYIVLSNKPWWILRGGEGIFYAAVSPFNVKIEILGKPVIVPIIFYLNLTATLSMLLAASTMLLGSFLAEKEWSRPMIGFKGLMLPILFLVGLVISLEFVKNMGIAVPLMGEFILRYEIPIGQGIITETPSVAMLTSDYWIALLAGIISVLAWFFQRRS
jgi:hypothetical protein